MLTKGQKGFHIGGLGGFHNSWLVNKADSEREELTRAFTPGVSGGVLMRYYIEYSTAVGMDLLYSFQGQAYHVDKRIEDVTRSTRLLYLKLPLMLEFRTGLGDRSYFKGHFGPYVSFPQAAFRTQEGASVPPPGPYRWEQAYRSPVLGVMFGLGPGIRWGRGWASSLELRFDHDFTNAEEKASELISNYRSETYNATLGLMISLRYAFQDLGPRRGVSYP
jgi:hypothetical protein